MVTRASYWRERSRVCRFDACLKVTAGTLGHEDSKTTKDHYALDGVEEAAIGRRLFKVLREARRSDSQRRSG